MAVRAIGCLGDSSMTTDQISPVGSGAVAPRDKRRDAFLGAATAILVANVAVILWMGTGARDQLLDAMIAWFAGFVVGYLGWLIVGERRLPHKPDWAWRQPWAWDVDRIVGVIVALTFGVLNLSWHRWLPGWAAVETVPEFFLPDTVIALRVALTVIFATSLTVYFWVSLRILVEPMRVAVQPDSALG
jgi:hypothetical protein